MLTELNKKYKSSLINPKLVTENFREKGSENVLKNWGMSFNNNIIGYFGQILFYF